ncbi:MAG: signal peptidase II [Bacilli bacterium]|nr:signal peptidase II [Bacilli bacterium]
MNKRIFKIAIIVLIIDQIIKGLVSSNLQVNESIKVIKNIFKITYSQNTGAAWSILNNHSYIIIIISIIALVILFRFMYLFKDNKRNNISFGLIIGGTIGNFIDRIFNGYVIDFIDVTIFKYKYPIFNIADMCIVIGVILLIYAVFKGEDKSGNQSK